MRYGVEGYGLYFYCVEIIAGNLATDNINFDLKHDAETIAYRLKMDTLRVEEIMKYMVQQGLFQFNDASGRIMCLGLLKRLDVSTSSNADFKKLVANSRQLLETNSNYQELIAEEKRIEENRREEKSSKKETHPSLNVPMNATRYQTLVTDYGQATVDKYIQKAIDYIAASGKKPYKDYAAAAANYMERDKVPKLDKRVPAKTWAERQKERGFDI